MMITAAAGLKKYGLHASTIEYNLSPRGSKPWRGVIARLYDEQEVAELAERINAKRIERKKPDRECRQCGKVFRRRQLNPMRLCPDCYRKRQQECRQKWEQESSKSSHQPMTDEQIKAWNREHPFRAEGLLQGMNHLSQEDCEREINSAEAVKGRR